MSPFEFAAVRESNNLEAATHLVFNSAYEKWIANGAESLTTGELTVYCVETFFGEMCNGGTWQYFDNESGQLAEHATAALRRVGLEHYAEVLAAALARVRKKSIVHGQLDEGDPRHPWIEWSLKDDADEQRMEELEHRFIELYFADRDEFRIKLFRYILEHESEFVSQA